MVHAEIVKSNQSLSLPSIRFLTAGRAGERIFDEKRFVSWFNPSNSHVITSYNYELGRAVTLGVGQPGISTTDEQREAMLGLAPAFADRGRAGA
jgi:hypothetical protein